MRLSLDCKGISEEDYEYMLHFQKHEGLTSLLNYLREEGIDPRKNPIEFGTYELIPRGGIYHDDNYQTAVPGLFVAGDEAYATSSISMAATLGWQIGEDAAGYAKKANLPSFEQESIIEEKKSLISRMQSRKNGANWQEFNIALQQVMQDYAGFVRSDNMLDAGCRIPSSAAAQGESTYLNDSLEPARADALSGGP